MKNTILTILLTLVFGTITPSQSDSADYKALVEEVSSASTFEQVKSIIERAEELFSKHETQFKKDKDRLAREMLAFAILRKEALIKLHPAEKLKSEETGGVSFLSFYRKNALRLEKLLTETIEIYEDDLKIKSLNLATAKVELAQSDEFNFLLQGMSSTWNWRLEKHARNQELYLDAYKIRSELLGRLDDLVLTTALDLAHSYLQSSDFENALRYYELIIDSYQEKNRSKSKILLTALIMSGSIWKMAGNSEAVGRVTKQITEISGESLEFSESPLLLSPRANTFKYKGINPVRVSISNPRLTGVTASGRTVYADSMSTDSFQQRQVDNPPSIRVIGDGKPSIKRATPVKVHLRVDTDGNVVWLNAEEEDEKLKEKLESRIRKWKFKPFEYDGTPLEMNGYVFYYELKTTPLN